MLTGELTGTALDWAVAKCEGGDGLWHDTIATHWIKIDGKDRALSRGWSKSQCFTPSTDWAEGGPIIERELCELVKCKSGNKVWWEAISGLENEPSHTTATGLTPLIAAMRCYVKSKLGDNIEIPKELT